MKRSTLTAKLTEHVFAKNPAAVSMGEITLALKLLATAKAQNERVFAAAFAPEIKALLP